jgi:hypothetical protein
MVDGRVVTANLRRRIRRVEKLHAYRCLLFEIFGL